MEEKDEMLKQIEMITDLERNMDRIVQSQELNPDVMKVVKETYQELEEIFKKYNSKPQNTLEYARTSSNSVKQIAERMQSVNIKDKLQNTKDLCKRIQIAVEQEELGNQTSKRVKDSIEEIASSDNARNVEKINGAIEDWIKDSLQRANRILSARGASERTIEDQTQEVKMLIRRLSPINQKLLLEALENDDLQLLNSLMKSYEIYEERVKANENKNQERETFLDGLKEGVLTPAEQAFVAQKIIENGNDKVQELPDNVIE